jgi:Zn-dependent M16 (insulinase) family peptidase
MFYKKYQMVKREICQISIFLHYISDGIPVQYSAQPTNQVAYIKMVSFLDQVPEEMKIYVPLFTNIITK